jgi:ABC-type Fe3+-siderophore transport system permease subunit
LVGFFYRPISPGYRLLMLGCAILLGIPAATPIFKIGLVTDIIGAALFAWILLHNKREAS